jgi:phthalate 4,5-dioxygenase oxygenase subunit
MLSHEENQLLTQVGPGTPLGELMRRYWHPIALTTQVESDGAPLRTKLLGERFVVFRDSDGQVGVLDEFCMHRGASLALGRNEGGGLRCIYHGWKFTADGTITETPNHADPHFCQRMRAPAFPVREQSGLIWTYIGPPELEPPFRSFGFDVVPDSHRVVFRANNKASWLPLWEGGLDSSHVAILHGIAFQRGLLGGETADDDRTGPNDRLDSPGWSQLSPTYEFEDTEFGYQYCAFRDMGEDGVKNARMVPAIMPYMRIIPSKTSSTFAIEVPMDDLQTATYVIFYSDSHEQDADLIKRLLGLDSPYYDPETCDMNLEWDDRLGQDRGSMSTSWSGWSGIELEDFAMSVSQAEWDRSKEHLVIADRAVIRMRRMVLAAIDQLKSGETPPALDVADMTKVIGYDLDIPVTADWLDYAPDNRSLAHTDDR